MNEKLSSGICDTCGIPQMKNIGDGSNEPQNPVLWCGKANSEIVPLPESEQLKKCDFYKKEEVICKGSISLGTGCGECKHCKEEIKNGVTEMALTIENSLEPQKVDQFNTDLVNQENMQTQPIDNSPLAVMMNALNNGMSLEKVEKMMDLQERYEKREAEKEYNSAMAEFKKTPVEIKKDKTNAQYNSKYSSIGATVNPCLPGMGECGLSHKWEFEPQTDKGIITGRCIVTHKGGHSESVDMSCPVDQSGKKNAIQQIKSTRTYIKIETFTSIMGLTSSEDVDDDGNGAGPQVEYISETQVADLTAKIEEKEVDQQKFLSFFKVDKLEDLLLQDFKRAIMMLEKKQ